jgi:hypothetical protein
MRGKKQNLNREIDWLKKVKIRIQEKFDLKWIFGKMN